MSKAIGIVAEYNPFHNGHAHHLREAKRIAGNRPVIAAMSGSLVQRGLPATDVHYPGNCCSSI